MSFDKDEIRELLIKSAHSNEDSKFFLKNNLSDDGLLCLILDIAADDDSNDARMEAAYWIKQFDVKMLSKHEAMILELQKDELDSVACPAMIALGRIKSKKGLEYLISDRIAPELYWEAEALKLYFDLE